LTVQINNVGPVSASPHGPRDDAQFVGAGELTDVGLCELIQQVTAKASADTIAAAAKYVFTESEDNGSGLFRLPQPTAEPEQQLLLEALVGAVRVAPPRASGKRRTGAPYWTLSDDEHTSLRQLLNEVHMRKDKTAMVEAKRAEARIRAFDAAKHAAIGLRSGRLTAAVGRKFLERTVKKIECVQKFAHDEADASEAQYGAAERSVHMLVTETGVSMEALKNVFAFYAQAVAERG